ncbi:MAG: hypothetical protein OTI36_20505 [Beijerinckiaceae bacterium]|nr:hypothetical protein [Beijerinckiaceae bacterium]
MFNGLGAAAWLAGLMYAKGIGARADLLAPDDHHLLIGATVGLVGLSLLVWENLRSAS